MVEKRQGRVRIIAGKWRGRVISFPDSQGLRPTHDRIRETLFNWLAPDIVDANCLDLFAGSGVLGFEALSRGAKKVVMIDNESKVVAALRQTQEQLQADNALIMQDEIPTHPLKFSDAPFDILFLDPPFKKGLLEKSIRWVEHGNYLQQEALIYIECENELDPLPVPPHWEMIRTKKTASLSYYLFLRQD